MLCVSLGLMLLSGCGDSSLAYVEGTVTLNGQALETGIVTFYPVSGGPVATGAIASGGHYQLNTGQSVGIAPGTYVVTIEARKPPSGPADQHESVGELLVPEKYTDKTRSALLYEVPPGTTEIDLGLKTP